MNTRRVWYAFGAMFALTWLLSGCLGSGAGGSTSTTPTGSSNTTSAYGLCYLNVSPSGAPGTCQAYVGSYYSDPAVRASSCAGAGGTLVNSNYCPTAYSNGNCAIAFGPGGIGEVHTVMYGGSAADSMTACTAVGGIYTP